MEQLRFRIKIQHSSLIDAAVGHFSCKLEESHLTSGLFHFPGYGEIAMSEVLRLIETSHLTKGLRRRQRQVRFVCVLKGVAAASENGEDADDPYFCASIDTTGWQILNAIIDKHEV